jgi:hypothetical protein
VPTAASSPTIRPLELPMTSKKPRRAARQPSQRGPVVSLPTPHPPQPPRKAVESHPFLVALVSTIVGVVLGGIITYGITPKNQAAANAAQIKAEQAQEASALRQYAQQVSYGIGPAPASNNGSPQLIIENRSSGWLRDVTLIVAIPTPANGIYPSIKSANGMVGEMRINNDENGSSITFQFANIPPCEIGITKILAALPSIEPGDLAASRLVFTDQNGNGWVLRGNGQLIKGIDFLTQQEMGSLDPFPPGSYPNGPGTSGWAWSDSGNLEQVVGGCSSN